MKTNIGAFQRDFPRMRRLAAAGTVILVESEGQSFEFRRRRRAHAGVLGCMTSRAKLGNLRECPAPPLEEWAPSPDEILARYPRGAVDRQIPPHDQEIIRPNSVSVVW